MGQRVTNSQTPAGGVWVFSCLKPHWMRIALTLKCMWLVVQNTSSHLLPPPPPPSPPPALPLVLHVTYLPHSDSIRHATSCWSVFLLYRVDGFFQRRREQMLSLSLCILCPHVQVIVSSSSCNEESICPRACCCGYTSTQRELTSDKNNSRHDWFLAKNIGSHCCVHQAHYSQIELNSVFSSLSLFLAAD